MSLGISLVLEMSCPLTAISSRYSSRICKVNDNEFNKGSRVCARPLHQSSGFSATSTRLVGPQHELLPDDTFHPDPRVLLLPRADLLGDLLPVLLQLHLPLITLQLDAPQTQTALGETGGGWGGRVSCMQVMSMGACPICSESPESRTSRP